MGLPPEVVSRSISDSDITSLKAGSGKGYVSFKLLLSPVT